MCQLVPFAKFYSLRVTRMLTKKPAVHWRMIEPLCVYDYVLSLFCINAFSGVCYYYYYYTTMC
jgi:hypothetical protein